MPTYTPTLDPTSAAVVPGDSVVSANIAGSTNVTRAVAASVANSVAIPGVVTVGGAPGAVITVQLSGILLSATTGLGAGSVAKVAVNGTTGKLARVLVPDGSEKIVGSCDGQGNLTLAPVDHVGAHAHHVINVSAAPYNCIGDGVTDCSAGIQAAINQALATGRSVYFPGQGLATYGQVGTYAIATPLNIIGTGITLFGDVHGASLLQSQYAAGIKAIFPVTAGTAAKVTALSVNPNTNQASYTNIMTVQGLSGLTVNNVQVGDSITLGHCAAGNAGTHTILSINLGALSVTCCNNNFDQLTGAQKCVSPDYGTGGVVGTPTMTWAIARPMLRIYGQGNTLRGLRFDGNNVAGSCVDSTAPLVGGTSTDTLFEHVGFLSATYLVKIGDYGPNAVYKPNCDLHRFYHCSFIFGGHSCVYDPNCTAESREHAFIDCTATATPFFFWFILSNFYVERLQAGSIARLDLYGNSTAIFYGSLDSYASCRDLTAENCGRVYMGCGVSTATIPVVFDGIRLDSSAGQAPQDLFVCNVVSGLVVKNGYLGSPGLGLNFYVAIVNAGVVGGRPPHVILENLLIARNDTNCVQARSDTGGAGTWYALGVQCNDSVFQRAVTEGYHIIGVGEYNPFQAVILALPSTVNVLPTPGGINHLPELYTTAEEYVNSTGAFSIGSHAHAVTPLEGRELEFNYYGAHAMTIVHHDATDATVANRFDCPGGANIIFPAGNACFFARWSSRMGMWEVTGLGPTFVAKGTLLGTVTASGLNTAPSSSTIVTVGSVSLATTQANQRVQILLSGAVQFPGSSAQLTFGVATDSTTTYDQKRTVDGAVGKWSQLSMERSVTIPIAGAHTFNVLAQLGGGSTVATIEIDITVNAYAS